MSDLKCPAECRQELAHINQRIDRLREMEKTQWEEIDKRVKFNLFFWVIGLAVAVLASLLGLIYSQAGETQRDIIRLMVQSERMETKIVHNTEMLHSASTYRKVRDRNDDSHTRTHEDGR